MLFLYSLHITHSRQYTRGDNYKRTVHMHSVVCTLPCKDMTFILIFLRRN